MVTDLASAAEVRTAWEKLGRWGRRKAEMESSFEEKMDLISSVFISLNVKEQDEVLSRLLRVCQLPQLKKIYTELCPLLSIDFVLILPQELVERIFSFLSAEDLCRMACCNRSWREFTNTDILWQPLCAVQNWLNFDIDQQLFSKNQYSYSPTGLTSPRYSTATLSDFPTLSPTCRWKEIYIRACYLNQNWAMGRYTVLPLLRGHQERVDCLDCDGKRLVSGSSDKTARVWDLFTAICLHVLDSHTDAVTSVCIKNEVIVTGCADSLIRIFQTETGICLRALMGHNSGIDHLCFDGTQVVSASSDRTLRVWSIQDGRCRKILRGHEDEIQYLAMKEHLVASTSWDHTVRMWNIQRGECTAVLKGHTEVVNCCQFDCRYVVSGGGDCLVLIWLTDSGKLLCKCQGHTGDVYCLMFNEKTICSGSSDSTIRVWDFTGKCLFTMSEHIGVVRCLHLDGNRLISGGDRKKILVWDVANGKLVNIVHRNPSLLHKIWVNETKVITASPESPGILTILSYW
ncbi:F-box/WD repeat-containing protein 7-like [Carcharodon carcharias]|uniref:F-box/WD repeat-containing protein 7-like n=1 Tax=Carcharodon carcharias TaxID=13397 RepID=UPI001B7D9B46|nr:F-box/WD repeat-containing protein 7-like [Carcharodon carcharias]